MSNSNSTLTQELLRHLLCYDKDTGIFTWNTKPMKSRVCIGHAAGNMTNKGYWEIRISGFSYKAHRLAWMHVHGLFPSDQLDHINGNRSDNRICNLREATNSQNQQNKQAEQKNTKSGLVGVSPNGSGWRAKIVLNGKVHHLGTFKTPKLAQEAYINAKDRLHVFSLRLLPT